MEVKVLRDDAPEVEPVQTPLGLRYRILKPACHMAIYELIQFAYELSDDVLHESNWKSLHDPHVITLYDPNRKYLSTSGWIAYAQVYRRTETFAIMKEMWRRGMDIDKLPPKPDGVHLAMKEYRKNNSPDGYLYLRAMQIGILNSPNCMLFMNGNPGEREPSPGKADFTSLPRDLIL